MIEVLFLLFAAVALGSAINVLVQKHVLYSSLSLILLLTAISALFVLMQAASNTVHPRYLLPFMPLIYLTEAAGLAWMAQTLLASGQRGISEN